MVKKHTLDLTNLKTWQETAEKWINKEVKKARAYTQWLKYQNNLWKVGKSQDTILYAERLLSDNIDYIKSKYIKTLMRSLKYAPRHRVYPKDYPIKFTSDKQRKFVMANLKTKPYKRRNVIKNGWNYTIKADRYGRIVFELWNDSPTAKYVVGEVGLEDKTGKRDKYRKYIQKFHRKSGWIPAQDTFNRTLAKMKKDAKLDGITLVMGKDRIKL